MKNNINTTASNKMNNINTNKTMLMSRFHIVLRDKNNELVSWKGFAQGEDAFKSFIGLYTMFVEASDGNIRNCEKGLGFQDDFGNKVYMEKTTDALLSEILLCTRASAEDLFNCYFETAV